MNDAIEFAYSRRSPFSELLGITVTEATMVVREELCTSGYSVVVL
jgi:hypothetical protein